MVCLDWPRQMVDPAARLLYNNGENDNIRKETSAGLLTGGNPVRLGGTLTLL